MNRTQLKNSIPLIAWCFFDFANSGFYTIITTFIFATYFASKIAPTEIIGTAWWGYASAFAGIIVAIVSPLCGAIADYGGHRKLWLFCLTYLGIIAVALLWFAYPHPSYAAYTLALIMLSMIGFEVGMVFYNTFMSSITPEGYLGRVSGWGWGVGYVGGLISLFIALYFIQSPPSWLDTKTLANVRITGPLVAIWALIFSLPLFLLVKDIPSHGLPMFAAIKQGMRELMTTLKKLTQEKNRSILLLLIARIFYIDGINTLFTFGGIYAATNFGMSMPDIVKFGILLNITAGLGAMLFGWLDDIIGSKLTIFISLLCLIIVSSGILLIHSTFLFWLLAPLIGIFVGPTQAASRSLMTRIANPEQITEMFGLFALSGKITAFLGPWLVGLLTLRFNSQRIGMTIIVIFFLIGAIILSFVHEKRA